MSGITTVATVFFIIILQNVVQISEGVLLFDRCDPRG